MKNLLRTLAFSAVLAALPALTAASPVIGTSPSSLSFGNVVLGSSSTLPVTMQNLGDANLVLTSISITGVGFSLISPPGTPWTIPPGGTTTLNVRLAPSSIGPKSGTVTIASNDPVTPSKTISLSGTGVAALITASPGTLNFGGVNVASHSDLSVILGNDGNQILTVTSETLSGPDAASFSLISGPTPPFNLSPGSTIGVGVRFAPGSASPYNASLSFGSNDPLTPTKVVTLQGTGIGPILNASPPFLGFGAVHVGTSANASLSLSNGGGGVLSITALSIVGLDASSFSLVSPPATPIDLTAGASVSLTVRFAPATIGAKAVNLEISSNDASSPVTSVELSGTSIRPEPVIAGVRDVPNDQGGKIKLSWDASTYDTQASPIVDHYWVLRSVPPQVALARIATGAHARPIGDAAPGEPDGQLYTSRAASGTIYWELLATVQALHFIDGYSTVAPTTSDSTPASNPLTLFMVMALNAANTSHWDSARDSGYSVDNLAPVAPAPLTGAYFNGSTHLHWGRNTEADLAGYRVYAGPATNFVPGPASLLATLPDTGFADPGPAGRYYKLSALDRHGNESPFALLTPDATTDVPGTGVTAIALDPPWPNPAGGEAELIFALPKAGSASLRIYDGQGRRIRILVGGDRPAGRQSAHWDGRDDAGHTVRSGVYFARLAAAGRTIDVRFSLMR
jgi:hypothetical protein